MITKTNYKDRPAIKVSAGDTEALFLPKDGGKFVSLKHKGKEFFEHRKEENYRILGLDTSYIESECSAFDDMFPTIDPCTINGMDYLDHGEVCRREHEVEIKDDTVTFTCELKNLNATFKKSVYEESGTLCIRYRIENHNGFDFPYLWAGHMMFKGESGAYAVSDFTAHDEKKVMFGVPETLEKAHILPEYGAIRQYKYYYTDAKGPIRCGVVYPKSNAEVSLEFDSDIVKYLGLWVNPGDLNGMYNIALEPCTALYDDPINAKKANVDSVIKSGETVEFTLKIKCKEI